MSIFKETAIVIFLFAGVTCVQADAGGDHPYYDSGRLVIPRVDSNGQIAKYQGVQFVLNPSGAWNLVDLRADGEYLLDGANILSAELILTPTLPQQAFIRIKWGEWECHRAYPVHQSYKNGHFEIRMFRVHLPPLTYDCGGMVGGEKIIPLPIYGLTAGTYTFSVYGRSQTPPFTGQFQLQIDNKLPNSP